MFHRDAMVPRLKLFRPMTALAALGFGLLIQPALADPPRAVVELFTSQGCSSCPPADALLTDLAHQPDIVALSFPVDYWDYLGWKDTLAKPIFTARQKAYAESRSDRQVYTPQIVVNGMKPCIGSDWARIQKSIQTTTGGRMALPLNVGLQEQNGTVTVTIEETPATTQRHGEVWIMPVARAETVPIGRGENRGKTVTYANVVRGIRSLGEWRGGPARFEIPAATARGEADGYVVLVQSDEGAKLGPILGAAKSDGL